MSRSRWLALGMGAVILVAAVVQAAVMTTITDRDLLIGQAINAVLALPYLAIGPYLALRRPQNAIGWLVGASITLILVRSSLRDHPGIFGIDSATFPQWSPAALLLLAYAIFVFPSGRLPPRRWSLLAAIMVALVLVLGSAAFGLVVVAGIAAVGSVILRFRKAHGIERQQLKWFASASVLVIALIAVNTALGCNSIVQRPGTCEYLFAYALWGLTFLAVPVAMTIAILRYRLYDIDVLIRRTLVYGATSAVLGTTFLAGIVLVQAVLRPFTGGNELAVAVSTLASFALFQPLRTRIQTGVDRRFYRSRYDAVRTLDDFSVQLRDEVDLDAVRGDLLDAVSSTVQPAHAGIWLRGSR